MPTLPSGIRVWLSMEAILPADRPFYPCPPGRFWFRDLDPVIDWDPVDGSAPQRFRLGVVPETRLDAAVFVRVLFAGPRESEGRWNGDWLLDLEQPDCFDTRDWKAMLDFVSSERVLEFLDLVIHRCRTQSDALARRGIDHAALRDFGPALHGRADSAGRMASAVIATRRIGADLAKLDHEHDFEAAQRLRDRLETLVEEADRSLDRFGPHRALAHRVIADASSRLGHEAEAVRHTRVFSGLVPDDRDFIHEMEERLGVTAAPLFD